MEVILREDVQKLGRRGDVVKVAEGYGRNYLLPRGLAMAVTDSNKAMIEKEKKAHVARLAKEKAEFETLAQRIADRELADVVLIDIVEGMPQGKGLDMREAGPVEGSDSQVIGTNDYADKSDRSHVVL